MDVLNHVTELERELKEAYEAYVGLYLYTMSNEKTDKHFDKAEQWLKENG